MYTVYWKQKDTHGTTHPMQARVTTELQARLLVDAVHESLAVETDPEPHWEREA